MAFWDGERWIDERVPVRKGRSRSGRAFMHTSQALLEGGLIAVLVGGLIVGTAFGAKGGKGNGNNALAVTACQVDGNVVSAGGLPTNEVINFMVTDSSGTWGWVLGLTDGDYWKTTVPDRTGPTTYEFASRTFGNNGTKYHTYASCSAN